MSGRDDASDAAEVVRLRALVTCLEDLLRVQEDVVVEQSRRLRADQMQLASSEEAYRTLFETSPLPVYVFDCETFRLLAVNEAASRMYGYSREELLVMTMADLKRPEDVHEMVSILTETRDALWTGSKAHVRKDGSIIYVDVTARPFTVNGESRRIVIAQDVTEKRRLETELRQAQKLESVGRLASGIAHEINTPVQFIGDSVHFTREAIGELFALLDKYRAFRHAVESLVPAELDADLARAEDDADLPYLQESLPNAMDRAIDGLERVATIVRGMKEFAHPDVREKTAVDLAVAIRSTLAVARNEYKYVAEIETDLGELPRVLCHAGELNQVILNLVVNAAHAITDVVSGTTEKGRITVRSWLDGDLACISVADTGGGIPEAIQARIFDPFFTTKEVGRGTGQGLAIARSVVVDKHGGSLTFETQAGRGTTFTICLPMSVRCAEPARAAA